MESPEQMVFLTKCGQPGPGSADVLGKVCNLLSHIISDVGCTGEGLNIRSDFTFYVLTTAASIQLLGVVFLFSCWETLSLQ